MKNTIKIVFALLVFNVTLSQERSKELSNAELFSSQKVGTLIEKEFIDVGQINNNTEIKILKITDMISAY